MNLSLYYLEGWKQISILRLKAKVKKSIGQMSEKLCGYRHLTDKRLENEKFKVSVKCLFYLLWIGHLTYRSDVYRSDGVTPFGQ